MRTIPARAPSSLSPCTSSEFQAGYRPRRTLLSGETPLRVGMELSKKNAVR